MIRLRQSTASQEIPLGPFVDSTDGNTEEGGLTIANTDIKIWKTGATTLANKNSGGATYISNGVYYAVLDATDTDTIGPLRIFVHVAGALAVMVACEVLDEAVYDAMFGTVALATATNITAGTITTVTNLTNDPAGVGTLLTRVGTPANLGSGATVAANLSDIEGFADDIPSLPTAAAIADAVWDEDATAHQTQGTFGQAIGDPAADTNTIYGAVVTGATGATIAADIITIDDFLDTEVAAIKAKTDNLPTDPADASDIATAFTGVNTKLDTIDDFLDTEVAAIKTVTDAIGATGTGLTAIPWNPAWDAEVESEANDALIAQNLDHLVKIAVDTDFATTVHLNSVVGHLADDGTAATFDRTTDSLEVIAGAGGGGGLDAAGVRAAIGLASANLDTQLAAIDDAIDTEVAAIKAKTDNLPADPADASDIAAAFATVNSALTTIDDFLDTEIAAIKAKTDNLPADPADASDIAASFVTVNTKLDTIDDLLDTEVAAIKSDTTAILEDTGTTLPATLAALNDLSAAQVNAEVVDALTVDVIADSTPAHESRPTIAQGVLLATRLLTEKEVAGTTVTVNKEDGTTAALTLTLDDATNPTSITRAT